jgi:hypothetical protein
VPQVIRSLGYLRQCREERSSNNKALDDGNCKILFAFGGARKRCLSLETSLEFVAQRSNCLHFKDNFCSIPNPVEKKKTQILQFFASSTLIQTELMKVNLQDERHDLHKCVTEDGITIVVNPEEKMHILQFVVR